MEGVGGGGEEVVGVGLLALLEVIVDRDEEVRKSGGVEELVFGGEGFPDGGVEAS